MAYLGENVAKLGFGLMRLPAGEGQDPMSGERDIKAVSEMADLFLDRGFTYFDTAYGYGNGASELAFREAVVKRHPRESYTIATKLPAWSGAQTTEEARQMFYTSMERLGVDYLDFYLLHNLGSTRTAVFDKFGIWDFAQELKQKGLVKHVGFSIHDKASALDEVLTKHPETEFVQLQINYADWETGGQQSKSLYETARKHNKPIIIMEPVKGGMLANPPENIKKMMTERDPNVTPSSWALRFAASLEGLVTVLSGMSTLEQVDENTKLFQKFSPLSSDEKKFIDDVRTTLAAALQVPCTACEYCMKDCPKKVVIPKIFDAMNKVTLYKNPGAGAFSYRMETGFGGKASECIACGTCEKACPQGLKIPELLKQAVEMFEKTPA